MTDIQALAKLVYPHLPSGRSISYSEISTFQNCPRQHYWRYFIRLSSKRYSELRNMVMGSVVHESTEEVYRAPDADPQKIISGAIARQEKLFESSSYAPYHNKGQFRTDMVVAKEMFLMWYNHLFQDKGIEIIEPEMPFDVEIAGQHFLGVIDRVYNVTRGRHPGIYVGELKTRGFSFRRGLRRVVEEDLQTKIYLAALKDKGYDPQGVVYTVLKKPHIALMAPMTGEPEVDEEIDRAISAHYADPKVGDHYKREAIPVSFDADSLNADLTAVLTEMNEFYVDPAASMAAAPVLNPNGFPCMFCEYAPICHEGKTIDGSFRYKQKRSV